MTYVLVEVVKNTRSAVVLMLSINTLLKKVDNINPDKNIIEIATDIIKAGGLVAFPTETVYGLGADGLNPDAVKKIYVAKGRPSDNPLILHISDVSQLQPLVEEITSLAYKLIDAFWPGPLTMIFKKSPMIPICITGGLDTVAIRLPSSNVARAIIEHAGTPIAAPSANSSGKPSPTRASHVQYDLEGKIDMIIDGGATEFGVESTVIDVTGLSPIILRPGAITQEMISEIVDSVEVNSIVFEADKNLKPKSPGMKYKHYSPKAKIIIVEGNQKNVVQSISNFVDKEINSNKKVGIMATEQSKHLYKQSYNIFVVGDSDKPETIAANLFKMLRQFDFLDMDIVYAEGFSQNNIGAAIMNRLEKAAGYNIIKV